MINANGEDIAICRVDALDKDGRPVPTADNSIQFRVSGEGTLIGVGNGDPNCHEMDKGSKRSLFNGLAQVIVQSSKTPGEIRIEAVRYGSDGPDLVPSTLVIQTRPVVRSPVIV